MTTTQFAIEVWLPALNEWRTVCCDRFDTLDDAIAEIVAAITDCEGLTMRVGGVLLKVAGGRLWHMTARRG